MSSWNSNSGSTKNFLSKIWPLALLGGFYTYDYMDENFIQSDAEKEQQVSYTHFVNLANDNKITDITIDGTDAKGINKDSNDVLLATYSAQFPENLNVHDAFKTSNADITIDNSSFFSWNLFIYILCALVAWDAFKETSLKKRLFKEKEIKEELSNVTFDDIAGIEGIKDEVLEVVQFLKGSATDDKFGIKTPKGILLAGSPGNGKTLLAKAIAGESGVPFYSAAATEFENAYYGNSSKQVRELFENAREKSPCILFIDEIDAIGQKRSSNGRSPHDSIVIELLNQMDGFDQLDNVIVIAATNQPESLDPALLRPGRFDRKLILPTPDIKARKQILDVHTKKRPLDEDVDLESLAQRTYGFSGADIANLVNEAAIHAARRPGAETITLEDFESATDRITMGIKRDLQMSKKDKWSTSVHEAGHTIIIDEKEKDGADPLHKVTITPHGEALGITMTNLNQEKYGHTLKELKNQLAILFGGRVAEEIMLGGKDEVGTGASNDIQRATDIAWNMVTKFGFSELGPIRFDGSQDGYLGKSSGHVLDEHTASKVYEQISVLVKEAEKECHSILTRRKEDLINLANALMERETMTAPEVKDVFQSTPSPAQKIEPS